LLGKFTLSYHFNVFKEIAIAARPSFNALFINETQTQFRDQLESLAPYTFFDQFTKDGAKVQMLVGGRLATS